MANNLNPNYYIFLGILFSFIIVIPFILNYYRIYTFLKEIINKEFDKAHKKIKKNKLLDLLFKEAEIKSFIHYKLDELNKFNYSLSLFYITMALITLIITLSLGLNHILSFSFAYTFFGITLVLFIYLSIKVWLQIKIIEYLIKLEESEIKLISDLEKVNE